MANKEFSPMGILRYEIKDSLKQLENYRDTQEEITKSIIIESKYYIHHEGEVHEDYGLDQESKWFPVTFRNSLFITNYAFFESLLIRICKILQQELGLKLSLKDIHGGTTIEKVQKYIKLVANLNFPDDTSVNWQFLKKCNILRNSIAHNYSEVDDKVSKLLPMPNITQNISEVVNELLGETHFVSNSGLHFTNSRFYLLLDFCKEVLVIISAFFREFFDANPDLFTGSADARYKLS
ncbi:hypothetical protein [Paenibacillus sp. XY044]|uniref:hypothetical protein n=1 Tax=Paenibacillus sp. XY044 TaxID=2026089 RepID=UPI000B98CB4E|nr:hypothetical protein [Paenibacillus sp. XY044]OZB94137.1 hypothetical protein CJP46_18150 [Paenibacillus sp. XY044]